MDVIRSTIDGMKMPTTVTAGFTYLVFDDGALLVA